MAALTLLVLALTTSKAQADPPGQTARELEARAHFERALEHSDAGRYAESLVELQRAYATEPHFRVLYNIGMVQVALEQPVEAIEALEAFLEAGGTAIPKEKRAQVEAQLERQRSRLSVVHVELDPPDALLIVDGKPIESLAGGLKLGAGTHRFVAVKQGYATATHEILLGAGETLSTRLALSPDPAALPAAASPEPAEHSPVPATICSPASIPSDEPASDERTNARKIWAAILAGGAVGLGVGAAGTFSAARKRFNRYLEVQHELDVLAYSGRGDVSVRELQKKNDELLQQSHDLELVGVGLATSAGWALTASAVILLLPRNDKQTGSIRHQLVVTPTSLGFVGAF